MMERTEKALIRLKMMMKQTINQINGLCKAIVCALLSLCFTVVSAQSRVVTDMAGRKVTIPYKINRLLPNDEKTSVFLFPVAADVMVARGVNRDGGDALKYIDKAYSKLPGCETLNVEEILRLNPDVVVAGCFVPEDYSRYERMSERSHKPFVIVDLNLNKLAESYAFLSSLCGDKAQAEACIGFLRIFYNELDKWKKAGKSNNASVYLAVGNQGLQSAPTGSRHTQLFDEMGLRNVVQSEIPAKGFVQLSIEQVLLWKPDYIFTIDKFGSDPYTEIRRSEVWKTIPAVQHNRVFHVPEQPFSWFGNPPSVNRIAGMILLSEFFYRLPQAEAHRRIIEFYRLFYRYTLTEAELSSLLREK